MSEKKPFAGFHLKKEIDISHFLTILILIFGLIFWATGLEGRVDAIEILYQSDINHLQDRLDRIEDKLDRILEK
tara:strand:- start:775 stop:996 length:222 start_codon:yes stop_codon:yes gene_type:complete